MDPEQGTVYPCLLDLLPGLLSIPVLFPYSRTRQNACLKCFQCSRASKHTYSLSDLQVKHHTCVSDPEQGTVELSMLSMMPQQTTHKKGTNENDTENCTPKCDTCWNDTIYTLMKNSHKQHGTCISSRLNGKQQTKLSCHMHSTCSTTEELLKDFVFLRLKSGAWLWAFGA